jgi:hypothetical protein
VAARVALRCLAAFTEQAEPFVAVDLPTERQTHLPLPPFMQASKTAEIRPSQFNARNPRAGGDLVAQDHRLLAKTRSPPARGFRLRL